MFFFWIMDGIRIPNNCFIDSMGSLDASNKRPIRHSENFHEMRSRIVGNKAIWNNMNWTTNNNKVERNTFGLNL